MSTPAKGIFRCDEGVVQVVATAVQICGDPILLPDGRAGLKIGLETDQIGDLMSVLDKGIVDFISADATLFGRGSEVWWDASVSQAVPALGTVDTGDFLLGTADAAKANGDKYVRTILNKRVALRPAVREFVTTTDNALHELIPAAQNSNGLVLELAYGIVTEVFAGATEDQGIVTIKDGDGNVLSTLTPTNAGADALNDVVIGTNKLIGGATGDAIKVIPAGKSVTAIVTQPTAGAGAAGKMRVYLNVRPLL